MPIPLCRFLPFAISLSLATAQAAGPDAGFDLRLDPFASEAMAPLKPSPRLSARVGEAPCSTELPATPLAAIDAVDLALCNNPQTR